MFSPPFQADTMTIGRDRALWEIVTYLKSELNEAYKTIACNLDTPIRGDEPVIRGIADYNAWSMSSLDFPLLTAYRRFSSGEFLEDCSATLAYYLPSVAFEQDVPGIMRWVEVTMGRKLRAYSDFYATDTSDRRHAHITGEFRTEYGRGVQVGTAEGSFPFFRLLFDFQEIGV